MSTKPLYHCLLWVLYLFAFFSNAHALETTDKPPVMLAEVYQPDERDVSQYWISEKLDGVRARWDGKRLISRGGQVFANPDWFTQGFPAQALDGELWIARERFADTVSIVKREQAHEGWREIKFMLFDLPEHPGTFSERLSVLRELVQQAQVPNLQMIEQFRVQDNAELMQRLDEITEQGGEGLMLHAEQAYYHRGRSDDLLKLKKFAEGEATVLGYRPGKGRLSGMVGSLQVRTDEGIEFYIGSGLKDADRQHPPAIGSRINFKHQGFTSKGKPRFAVFLRVRDKIEK